MIVVGSEGSITLGTLPLPGFVACTETVVAKDVEAFPKDSILFLYLKVRGEGEISATSINSSIRSHRTTFP